MDLPEFGGGEVAWRPSPERIARSNLRRMMDRHGFASYEAFFRRSVEEIAWFWDAILREELRLVFSRPYDRVLDLSRGPEWPVWCVGGALNIAANCLDRYAGTPQDDRPALKWEGEEGTVRTLSYRELKALTDRAANALRALGVRRGDAVGVFMPMVPEIAAAMLAIIKIGGIFIPLFSGFGAQAIASRLNDAQARVLFTADGCFRRGRAVPMKTVADEAAALVPSLSRLVVLRRAGIQVPWNPARDLWWHEAVAPSPASASAEPTSAEDPMMLIHTSGTTGRPKGAVHTHCGFPVKAAQDMLHGLDLHPDDTLYWVTDMGWMMGPWLVFGTLLLGAAMVMYDGAPDFPGPDRLWALAARHRVTVLGVSPTLIRALLRHGEAPVRRHDLSALAAFASTGEPWNPDPWRWLFEAVGGGRIPILNYSGGTEVSGGIVMGNVLSPLKPCSFAGPVPGMDGDVVDEEGRSVRGRQGELVVRRPWIGMTRGFWKDPDRYIETYWSRFPGVWVHGDYALVDEDGLWYILGRSDDTIKIAGKRVGPAEVESVLVGHPAVGEAAAVGVPDELKGEALAVFCVLRPGFAPGEPLREELRDQVARELGKPLSPKEVRFVRDLPRTRNAKIMRRVVRAAFLGLPPGDLTAMENPGAVEEIRGAV